MRPLLDQPPTPEQLRIISEGRPGTDIIRGAAGSGKTHTAILRLETLTQIFQNRLARIGGGRPVKVLVLTFNRTLCGYIEAFVKRSALVNSKIGVEVETFSRWAINHLGARSIIDSESRKNLIKSIARDLGLPLDFVCNEFEYIVGRFSEVHFDRYLSIRRDGRGAVPRMERHIRVKLVEALKQYRKILSDENFIEWDDLANELMLIKNINHDIVIIDEAQDFSANQIRSIIYHLAPVNFLTLILDTAQRLYPRGYTWGEVGLGSGVRYHRLAQNHRNTKQIAAFASGILQDLQLDDDGTLPDFSAATRIGDYPQVVTGYYRDQVSYAINLITRKINLEKESVAFLKPGTGFFFLEEKLRASSIAFEVITRNREWPTESVNVVLSTMHSAKGLEFDHVFILGLNAKSTPHGEDKEDDQFQTLRRLLAMAIARARISVHIGYKRGEESDLVQFFIPGTFNLTEL